MNLSEIRDRINAHDNTLLAILAERFKLTSEVAEYKRLHDMPTFVPEREASHVRELVEKGIETGLPEVLVKEIFFTIMSSSRAMQDVDRGIFTTVSVRQNTYCTPCGWRTAGIDGPPGSTSRICFACKRPLTTQVPPNYRRNHQPHPVG